MSLYEELFVGISQGESTLIDGSAAVELVSFQALQKIQAILADERLDDKECFIKIEDIICIFEALGSHGGGRHDFG